MPTKHHALLNPIARFAYAGATTMTTVFFGLLRLAVPVHRIGRGH